MFFMRRYFDLVWKNEFLKGGLFLTTSAFITNFIYYLVNILTARGLGPTWYGEVNTLLSYTTIISVPLTVVSTIVIQKISSSTNKQIAMANAIEQYAHHKAKQ